RRRAPRAALPRLPRIPVGPGVDLPPVPGLRSRVGGGGAARPHLFVGARLAPGASGAERSRTVRRRAGRAARGRPRAHDWQSHRRPDAGGHDRRVGGGGLRAPRRRHASVHARTVETVVRAAARSTGEASLREERAMTRTDVVVNEPNQWRLATPGHTGWARTARPGDPRKYFMVSADCHANEPHHLWATRIDEKYRHRVPKVITDGHGVK